MLNIKRVFVAIFVTNLHVFGVFADDVSTSGESTTSNEGDDKKFVDLLSDSEKNTFLENVARRIIKEIAIEDGNKLQSGEIPDDMLKKHAGYVNAVIKEETEKLKNETKSNNTAALESTIINQLAKEVQERDELQPVINIQVVTDSNNKTLHDTFTTESANNANKNSFDETADAISTGHKPRRSLNSKEQVQDNGSNSNPDNNTSESPQTIEESTNSDKIETSISDSEKVDETTKTYENAQANNESENSNKSEIPELKSEKLVKDENDSDKREGTTTTSTDEVQSTTPSEILLLGGSHNSDDKSSLLNVNPKNVDNVVQSTTPSEILLLGGSHHSDDKNNLLNVNPKKSANKVQSTTPSEILLLGGSINSNDKNNLLNVNPKKSANKVQSTTPSEILILGGSINSNDKNNLLNVNPKKSANKVQSTTPSEILLLGGSHNSNDKNNLLNVNPKQPGNIVQSSTPSEILLIGGSINSNAKNNLLNVNPKNSANDGQSNKPSETLLLGGGADENKSVLNVNPTDEFNGAPINTSSNGSREVNTIILVDGEDTGALGDEPTTAKVETTSENSAFNLGSLFVAKHDDKSPKKKINDKEDKTYKVFEILPDEPAFYLDSNRGRVPNHSILFKVTARKTSDNNVQIETNLRKEQSSTTVSDQAYLIPVYNYSSNNAYFNPINRLGPNDEEEENKDILRNKIINIDINSHFDSPALLNDKGDNVNKPGEVLGVNVNIQSGSQNPGSNDELRAFHSYTGKHQNNMHNNIKIPEMSLSAGDLKRRLDKINNILYYKQIFDQLSKLEDKKVQSNNGISLDYYFGGSGKDIVRNYKTNNLNEKLFELKSENSVYNAATPLPYIKTVNLQDLNLKEVPKNKPVPSRQIYNLKTQKNIKVDDLNTKPNHQVARHPSRKPQKIKFKVTVKSDINMDVYLEVLKDMINRNFKVIRNYDFLGTAVNIQAALQKLFYLIDRVGRSKKIYHADAQILKYLSLLHSIASKVQKKRSHSIRRNLGRHTIMIEEDLPSHSSSQDQDIVVIPKTSLPSTITNRHLIPVLNFGKSVEYKIPKRIEQDSASHSSHSQKSREKSNEKIDRLTFLIHQYRLMAKMLQNGDKQNQNHNLPRNIDVTQQKNQVEKSSRSRKQTDLANLRNLLVNIEDGLSTLHKSIKSIALRTRHDQQNWINSLKEMYTKKGYLELLTSKKHLLELLLHFSTSNLFELIEEATERGLENSFMRYMKKNRDTVRRTIQELIFVLKVLKELQNLNN